jgi:gluconate 2-dehydrogenase gamma chain
MAKSEKPNALSHEEGLMLAAIAERIFPTTDTPGAVEIGAVNYIEIALAGDYTALAPLYRQGLRAVNLYSRSKFNKTFLDLTNAEKDAVLRDFEAGVPDSFAQAAEFFETLRYHVLEGVFCEPQYGGNKDMTGWHLVDFPGQQFGYADAYIDKRVDLEPVSVDSTPPQEEDTGGCQRGRASPLVQSGVQTPLVNSINYRKAEEK